MTGNAERESWQPSHLSPRAFGRDLRNFLEPGILDIAELIDNDAGLGKLIVRG